MFQKNEKSILKPAHVGVNFDEPLSKQRGPRESEPKMQISSLYCGYMMGDTECMTCPVKWQCMSRGAF